MFGQDARKEIGTYTQSVDFSAAKGIERAMLANREGLDYQASQ